jgi:eukaryotic-like serine/threonine-protein kinase
MYDDNPEEPVDALIATCVEVRRTGRKADFESIVQENPQYEPEIASFLEDYDQIESKFAPLRELLSSEARGAGEVPTLGRSEATISPVPQAGSSFGDYELLAEVSRGGMGVVFKARQQSLGRVVALKMLLDGGKSSTDRERFLVEARAVARLSHPHIVPIYEVGEHGGRPFFTMEFVAGGSLRERIGEFHGDQRAIARLMVTVARAVEHAHRRGILHRDLKPGNVLLDELREPHVTDFGLAKRLDEESGLTQDGAIVGTPSYMAPEQAQAASDLSTAVDVYGLGAVLYELLTGRPPFKGETVVETMMKARSQSPPAPRTLAADIDPDLETICLKCLEREPQARYGSAARFADDLERWLEDKPIQARKVSVPERLVKWGRRQPLLASAAATIAVAVLGLLILGGFLWQDAEQRAAAVASLNDAQRRLSTIEQKAGEQEQRADTARKAAETADNQFKLAERSAVHTLYAADMLLAHAAWEGDNLTAVNDLLGRYQNLARQDDIRGFEWHYLYRQLHGARLSWRDTAAENGSPGSILGMAISPDGKTLATAQKGSKLKLWNLADGRLLQEIESKPVDAGDKSFANVAGLFFADEGRKLVAVARRAPSPEQADWSVPAAAGAALLASPGLLAASSPSGIALAESAMNAGSTAMTRSRRAAASRALAAIFNKAAASSDKLKIESLADALEFQEFTLAEQNPPRVEPFEPGRLRTSVLPLLSTPFTVAHDGQVLIVLAVDRSPDGKFLAVAGAKPKGAPAGQEWSGAIAGGKLIVWDLAKGTIHAEQDSTAAVTAVTFSPDSATLATGNSNGEIALLEPNLAQPLRVLSGNHGWIYSLRFTNDGTRLASGARDGLVLLWDVASGEEITRLRGHTSAVCRIELSSDGQTLVSGGMDGTIKVWDLARASQSSKVQCHESSVVGLAFNAVGDQLISVDVSGVARTWRMTDFELLPVSKSPDIDDLMSRVSSSGKTIAWRDKSNEAIWVRDIATGRQTRFNWPGRLPIGVTLSRDDKLVAAGDLSNRGGLAVWNIASGRQLAALEGVKAFALALPFWSAFSPDTKLLACAQDGGVLLWDWQRGKSRRILEAPGLTATAFAFSADGKLIAVAANDTTGAEVATVRVWDLQANQLLCECHGAGQEVTALAFSPDGRRLATGGTTSAEQGILKLWDTTGGREVFSAQVSMAKLTTVTFSADGRRLAAAVTPVDWSKTLKGRSAPSEIHVWDATPVANDAPK